HRVGADLVPLLVAAERVGRTHRVVAGGVVAARGPVGRAAVGEEALARPHAHALAAERAAEHALGAVALGAVEEARAAAVVSVEAAAVVERGAALGQRTGAGILAAALHGTPPERGRLGVVHHAHRAGRAIHLEARVVGGLVDAAGLALG